MAPAAGAMIWRVLLKLFLQLGFGSLIAILYFLLSFRVLSTPHLMGTHSLFEFPKASRGIVGGPTHNIAYIRCFASRRSGK